MVRVEGVVDRLGLGLGSCGLVCRREVPAVYSYLQSIGARGSRV